MDHSLLFLNYKRNIQAIIKITFRLCALIPVGLIQGKILYYLVTSRSNHDRRIMSKNQGVYTALKSAVIPHCFNSVKRSVCGQPANSTRISGRRFSPFLTPCVKNFTAVPVPSRKSGQTFKVCDHHYFWSYYGLNTGVSYLIVKVLEEVYVGYTKRVGE